MYKIPFGRSGLIYDTIVNVKIYPVRETYYEILNLFVVFMVQLRCNFTLACKQFTRAHKELLMACALLPAMNSRKIIR